MAVAHRVTTIVIQAESGAATANDADHARRTFATIAASGRESLDELRRLLGLLREEEGHLDYGTNKTAEMAAKGGESKERAQRAVDYWYVKALDMFGRSESKRSERYIHWGLKRRTNAQARQEYMNEVNPMIEKMGLRIPDPNQGRLYL